MMKVFLSYSFAEDEAGTGALAVDSPADLPSVAGTIVDRLRGIG